MSFRQHLEDMLLVVSLCGTREELQERGLIVRKENILSLRRCRYIKVSEDM